MKDDTLVSIIIPVLNSEKTLARCLNSIIDQTYRNIETIVVDGGSEDKTVEIADSLGAKVVEAHVASMTKQTNLGVMNSEGKYIYRVDSDVILPSSMVSECVDMCEAEGYDGTCIFWLPDDSISFWAKVRKIEKESYIQNPNYVGSVEYDKNVLGARFLSKNVFNSIGGFEEGIPTLGEDYALYNKLASSEFKFATVPSREKHIGEPRRFKDIILKNFRYGTALSSFLKYNDNGLKQFSPLGRKYLIDALIQAMKKDITLFIGLIIYLSTVYSSTAMGMFYHKITSKTKRVA